MNGRDITVEFTPAEGTERFPKTSIRVKPNTSAATEDKGVAEKVMNQIKITDLFPEPTYEELEQALADWMNPENADSDTTTPTTNGEAKTETTTKTEPKKTADVATAFNDLFNQ
jgi:hypothetical protein